MIHIVIHGKMMPRLDKRKTMCQYCYIFWYFTLKSTTCTSKKRNKTSVVNNVLQDTVPSYEKNHMLPTEWEVKKVFMKLKCNKSSADNGEIYSFFFQNERYRSYKSYQYYLHIQ